MSDIASFTADLGSADSAIRAAAAKKLAQLGPDARDAAVALVGAAGSSDESVVEWAAAALEELGPPPVASVDELNNILVDDNADAAYWAATLLGRLGADGGGGVAALATALADSPHLVVRQRSAWALGKIGAAASSAVERLLAAAESDDPRLARLAAEAVEAIGP